MIDRVALEYMSGSHDRDPNVICFGESEKLLTLQLVSEGEWRFIAYRGKMR